MLTSKYLAEQFGREVGEKEKKKIIHSNSDHNKLITV